MDSHLYRKPAPALEELPLFASDRPAAVETAPADERWRPVVGFEGRYEVSDLGRVRSFPQPARPGRRADPGCILKPAIASHGYPMVVLGRGNSRTVHSLVADAFIGLRSEGQEVRHKNGDRTDPRAVNLEYGTRSDNLHDSIRHGTWTPDRFKKKAEKEEVPDAEVPWYEGALAALDFESTGVDPFTCRPVSVAFYCDDPEGEHALFQYSGIVDCGVDVPETTAAIHGITTERVRKEGRPILSALEAICARLGTAAAEGIPVVIMNVRYDWTLLRAELERHDCALPEGVALIDPIIIDQKFDKYRKGKRRLADLCNTYGLPALDDAHDAMADARAAIGVTRAMARKYLSSAPLRDLAMLQGQWFETFRVSRNLYWKSQGDERFMEPGWPLLDREAAA